MPVGTHDEKIGFDFPRVAHNLFTRIGPVPDGCFDFNIHLAKRRNQAVEIFPPGLHFSRRGL